MKRLMALVLVALPLASLAFAGQNSGALAYLSWSPTSQVNDMGCAAVNNLYVRIERAGGISFTGAEIDLTWMPPGNDAGCFDHIGTVYKTSTGTTCTYLNRGSAVPVVYADDPNHFHVAWSNATC